MDSFVHINSKRKLFWPLYAFFFVPVSNVNVSVFSPSQIEIITNCLWYTHLDYIMPLHSDIAFNMCTHTHAQRERKRAYIHENINIYANINFLCAIFLVSSIAYIHGKVCLQITAYFRFWFKCKAKKKKVVENSITMWLFQNFFHRKDDAPFCIRKISLLIKWKALTFCITNYIRD